MRSLPTALLLILLLSTAHAQVLATQPLARALSHARALEAGATATDLPHHVHYELQLYNHKGKLTRGTWDIWRDPQHYVRTDIVAGDFRYTDIEDLIQKKKWRHFNTVMPLKIYDLRQNYPEPDYAVNLFNSIVDAQTSVTFQQVQGSPFDCTSEILRTRICFDPLAHVFAFTQMFNQTITWEDWQPLGAHTVPRRFRIYDAGRIMAEANGHADIVKTFPPGLFTIPPNQPDMGEPEDDGSTPHKIVSSQAVQLDELYGNALVNLLVKADGKVGKVDLIDADDDDIVHLSVEFAKHLTFAPELKNGLPTPFQQYIYLRYAIAAQ